MYRVPRASFRGSITDGKKPSAVAVACPHCGERVTLRLESWHASGNTNTQTGNAICPSCQGTVFFYYVFGIVDDPASEVFMYPAPRPVRQVHEGTDAVPVFDEKLRRAYSSAVNAYNIQDWNGAAAHCGRVLEGIAKALLPPEERGRPLAQMLRRLPEHVPLQDPIIHLADGIREGRNIGAHFDQEIETDAETADLLMDLLDYLIEYLFILPSRIEKLQQKLSRPGLSA